MVRGMVNVVLVKKNKKTTTTNKQTKKVQFSALSVVALKINSFCVVVLHREKEWSKGSI